MLRPRIIAATLAVVLSAVLSRDVRAIDTGADIPDFELMTNRSDSIRFSQLRGKFIYLDIWASWCGSCVSTLGWLAELQRGPYGSLVHIIPINVDTLTADAERALAQVGAPLFTAFDPQGLVPNSLNLEAMPGGYLIDPDGRMFKRLSGDSEDQRREVETFFTELSRSNKE